jgi:hypothetical protein
MHDRLSYKGGAVIVPPYLWGIAMDSYIGTKNGAPVSYVGNDATALFQVKVIISGLKACKIGMRLSRNATPTNLFKLASRYTGKVYKRGAYDQAIEDLRQWGLAMESALPVIKQ